MPHDAIPQVESKRSKDRVQNNVQWDDFAVIYIVSDLPTNTSTIIQHASTFCYDLPLLSQILIQIQARFIRLAQVVWWRGDNQLDEASRHARQQIKTVPLIENKVCCRIKFGGKLHLIHVLFLTACLTIP
ncbi:MAG: hypothetical protein AUK03_15045 [Anaerolineae bacterium CG2_30_64_16]|nr:MAG: hypothetical protein AUK03_15045 [Anaerolineae bacterium CG2_30_64_16]